MAVETGRGKLMKTFDHWSVSESFSEIVEEVTSEITEKASTWISKDGGDEVKMSVSKDLRGDLVFEVEQSHFSFKRYGPQLFGLYENGESKANFKVLKRSFSTPKLGNLTTADITSDGLNGHDIVVGNTDGEMRVLNCNSSGSKISTSVKLDGHASHVTKAQFFPSGVVILSSGLDMRLKVWDAKDGSNPRTFVGHRGTVNDFAMIDRGRNFVSASSDGSLKLWDCASGSSLHTLTRFSCGDDGVNTIALTNYDGISDKTEGHANEASRAGKAVFAGHDSGIISYHDIYNRVPIFEINPQNSSACTSLCLDSSYHLFTGFENGTLLSWDIRNTLCPLDNLFVNEYDSISKIYFSANSLYVASGIDNVFYVSVREGHIQNSDITNLTMPYERVSDFCFENDSYHSWCVGSNGLLLRH